MSQKLSNEARVGIFIGGTVILGLILSFVLGLKNPFSDKVSFFVTYRFAGGVEVGSPVRVSGIKVGKIEAIDFFIPKDLDQQISQSEPGSADASDDIEVAPVRLKVSVSREALRAIKKDSKFYINIAGIIGERYVEVTPGSKKSDVVKGGDVLVGVDPPRIDQLLSQSFDLAGKISDIIEKNKGDITKSIGLLFKLSQQFNNTLKMVDQSKVFQSDIGTLITNLNSMTTDLKKVTAKLNSPDADKTIALLHELIWRLEPLKGEVIKDVLQGDGIKARIRFF